MNFTVCKSYLKKLAQTRTEEREGRLEVRRKAERERKDSTGKRALVGRELQGW